jgi:hypothetical protein
MTVFSLAPDLGGQIIHRHPSKNEPNGRGPQAAESITNHPSFVTKNYLNQTKGDNRK